MSSARLTVIALVVASILAIGVLALRQTSLAFTLGVAVAGPVATLKHGDQVCQRPIDVPSGGEFDRVQMSLGTFHREGSPLRVTVKNLGGRVLSEGMVPGGYPDIARQPEHLVALDRRVGAQRVAVCVDNRGRHAVAVYGNVDAAARTSTAVKDGKPLGFDLALVFERKPRSKLSLIPEAFSRAALFRFTWMGSWTYFVLLAVLVLGGPWLILRGLRAATATSRDGT
jgi:hypothetical protein